jgi:alcohol dehydrogenase, propanol-preferring
MHAMMFDRAGQRLRFVQDAPTPRPGASEALIAVKACGVCRTDLHILDGELADPKLPLVPGHEIVGTVVEAGAAVTALKPGDRVGVPWLGHVCGRCAYCLGGRENLCDGARFTGYHIDGGYAAFAVADARFCLALPASYGDVEAAPLLCAGLIGYRALKFAGPGERIGMWGFGAAAHIAAQVAYHRGQRVYAFTRPGDRAGQEFARSLGAVWAGGSDETPPQKLDGSLIFAPAGELVPAALAATAKGGIVVCAGIHMSDIPSFPYAILWEERQLRSVANLTRADGEEFLKMARAVPVRTTTVAFPLREANEALARVREGRITGAAVLVP